METERWRKIEELYHSALEREGSRRAAFVEQACGGDESLRREVESLLAQARGHGEFSGGAGSGGGGQGSGNVAGAGQRLRTRRPLAAIALFGCSAKVAWARSTKPSRKSHAALWL